MEPFIAKPGETIVGLGLDFTSRLATGETILTVAVSAPTGISASATGHDGTKAYATLAIDAAAPDGDTTVTFTVTGTAGSIRIGSRTVTIRANSN